MWTEEIGKMKANIGKNKTMIIHSHLTEDRRREIRYKVEYTETRYLQRMITKDGKIMAELSNMINKARRFYYFLNILIFEKQINK